jgi:hypothetical protein
MLEVYCQLNGKHLSHFMRGMFGCQIWLQLCIVRFPIVTAYVLRDIIRNEWWYTTRSCKTNTRHTWKVYKETAINWEIAEEASFQISSWHHKSCRVLFTAFLYRCIVPIIRLPCVRYLHELLKMTINRGVSCFWDMVCKFAMFSTYFLTVMECIYCTSSATLVVFC